jgi:hypothetical protein
MLGGNNGNPMLPAFLDENRFQYQTNPSNKLQLFGSREFSHAFVTAVITVLNVMTLFNAYYCVYHIAYGIVFIGA